MTALAKQYEVTVTVGRKTTKTLARSKRMADKLASEAMFAQDAKVTVPRSEAHTGLGNHHRWPSRHRSR